jgi:tRNA threonylcarbamoyladenosine biosynthesis protein TsaE
VCTVCVVETSDPAETEALGAELATGLRPGDVVLVRGELGAGKTTLVRGAARALGVSDPVTSPTFGIAHRYRGAEVTVAHLDLYRLEALAGEDPGLLEDYLGADRIAFVEWPEAGGAQLAGAAVRVTLTHLGGDRRRVEWRSGGMPEVGEPHAEESKGADGRAPECAGGNATGGARL